MDKQKLTEEMNSYNIPELEAICETQGECYSGEEMRMIVHILEQKRQERKNGVWKFNIRETVCCIIGLLFITAGLAIGIYMILSTKPDKRKTGKRTLLAVFISLMIRLFMSIGGFSI